MIDDYEILDDPLHMSGVTRVLENPARLAVIDLCRAHKPMQWLVTRINVPREHRGKGIGREMLTQLCKQADAKAMDLILEVSPSDGLDFDQLVAWYKRYNFRLTQMGVMERKPLRWPLT